MSGMAPTFASENTHLVGRAKTLAARVACKQMTEVQAIEALFDFAAGDLTPYGAAHLIKHWRDYA